MRWFWTIVVLGLVMVPLSAAAAPQDAARGGPPSVIFAAVAPAGGRAFAVPGALCPAPSGRDTRSIDWTNTMDAGPATRGAAGTTLAAPAAPLALRVQTPARPVPVEYSEGYATRLKIHRYASYATVPLFVAEVALGQSLYNHPGEGGKKSAHGVVAAGIAGLFGLNTVTGIWNLTEARKDPNGRTRRTIHTILMLAADAGFVATGALAPGDDYGEGGEGGQVRDVGTGGGRRATHRAVALGSMGTAIAGYLTMLIGRD